MVSFTQRAIGAICYEVEAVDRDMNLVIQSELVANEELPLDTGDPRAAAGFDHALTSEKYLAVDNRAMLVHRTARSGLRVQGQLTGRRRVHC